MDWIEVTRDRGWWRALVKAVMNFGFYKRGEFLDWLRTG
jgi:hypothetical protein